MCFLFQHLILPFFQFFVQLIGRRKSSEDVYFWLAWKWDKRIFTLGSFNNIPFSNAELLVVKDKLSWMKNWVCTVFQQVKNLWAFELNALEPNQSFKPSLSFYQETRKQNPFPCIRSTGNPSGLFFDEKSAQILNCKTQFSFKDWQETPKKAKSVPRSAFFVCLASLTYSKAIASVLEEWSVFALKFGLFSNELDPFFGLLTCWQPSGDNHLLF